MARSPEAPFPGWHMFCTSAVPVSHKEWLEFAKRRRTKRVDAISNKISTRPESLLEEHQRVAWATPGQLRVVHVTALCGARAPSAPYLGRQEVAGDEGR